MKQQACGRNERMSPSSARRDAECVAGCLFSRSLDRRGHPVDSMSVRGRSRGALTSAKKRTGLSLPSSPKRASTRFSSDKTAVARLRLFSHAGLVHAFHRVPGTGLDCVNITGQPYSARVPALVKGTAGIGLPHFNGGTARREEMGRRRAAVVLERAQQQAKGVPASTKAAGAVIGQLGHYGRTGTPSAARAGDGVSPWLAPSSGGPINQRR